MDKKENKDVLGNRWTLAPEGREKINICQNRILDIRLELHSYGTLLQNLAPCSLESGEFYGIGLRLERISKRLEKISDQLADSMIKDEP